jgi:hypothetical protein
VHTGKATFIGGVVLFLDEPRQPGWPAKVHKARRALIDQGHAVVDLAALPQVKSAPVRPWRHHLR